LAQGGNVSFTTQLEADLHYYNYQAKHLRLKAAELRAEAVKLEQEAERFARKAHNAEMSDLR
jgi:hypothetical protein